VIRPHVTDVIISKLSFSPVQTPCFILHFVLSFPKVFFICMHGFRNRQNMVIDQWPRCQFFIGFISSGVAHGCVLQNFRPNLHDFGKNVHSPGHASSTSKEHLHPSTRSASPNRHPHATACRHSHQFLPGVRDPAVVHVRLQWWRQRYDS